MGKASKIGLEKKQAFKAQMKRKRKTLKEAKKAKRAKLIVRNLPFKTNEENLRKHFEQYGDIEDINILKKSDGKLLGCAFVQYKLVQKAAKARHHLNGKPFLDRNIEIDFALAKDVYRKEKRKKEKQIKEEGEHEVDLTIVKTEDVEIKRENDDKEETCDQDIEENEKDVEGTEESDSQESSEEEEVDDTDIIKNNEVKDEKPHLSEDVSEGKTVFIKNIPFSATNEDLKDCMLQFGPLCYALICVDKLTEHSKGTAFVKYQHVEDAEKCLQAGTELKLLGNILDCHKALKKSDLQQMKENKRNDMKNKDSRNLYLIKEGAVLAGSKAAQGVSAGDMAKRLQLEHYKSQVLRNLNMFVSKNRLIVHNLPISWDDSKLRALFHKHAGPKAVIKEAKIMRNMKSVDSKGIGKSKEYGFVTFTTHEHALKALRSLNNNPAIFSEAKRPIVAFSIENRIMVKAKEKRLERSRLKNPNYKGYNPNLDQEYKNGNKNKVKQNRSIFKEEREPNRHKKEPDSSDTTQSFVGDIAKPGIKKMRSRYNLKTQAQLHYENIKKEKKKLRNVKKVFNERRLRIKQDHPNMDKKRKRESDDFAKLVNKYKQTLINAPDTKRKWYD